MWTALAAEAPPVQSGEADVTPEDCDQLLVAAREARPELVPTPDEALDGPVDEWLDQAEEIGFECDNHPDLEAGIEELGVLAAEIDAGIAALEGE